MDESREDALRSSPSPSRAPPEPPSPTCRPLASFTLFPKLIIELRLKIWEFCVALQAPRLVEVRTRPPDCAEHTGWCPRVAAGRVPTLVHVCAEARLVAHERARRAGHLCFGTLSSPPSVFFNPAVDRLYLPAEKGPWMRAAEEHPHVRARRPLAHHGTHQPYPAPSVAAAVPTTTLFQFQKSHEPAAVRFLVSDLDVRPRFMSPDSVWAVMRDFPSLEELVFVVPEHVFAYEDLVAEWARAALSVGQEKKRWTNASREGVVSWEWPVVRLAMKCKGGLKFIEFEGL